MLKPGRLSLAALLQRIQHCYALEEGNVYSQAQGRAGEGTLVECWAHGDDG